MNTHNKKFQRPLSRKPRNEELIRIVDEVVRKRFEDSRDVDLIIDLINQGNEMVHSAFDVFQSLRDENDLADTLKRIISSFGQKQEKRHRPSKSFTMPKQMSSFTSEKYLNTLPSNSGEKRHRAKSPSLDFSYFLQESK